MARFISADTAQSPLELAEDGKLPELSLQRDIEKVAGKDKASSMNPMLIAVALLASVALSIVLVFWDPASTGPSDAKVKARQEIRDNFFMTTNDAPLAPYQRWLREAQRAASRGDRVTERKRYQDVLDQLRAERGPFDPGLTGSRTRDKELEKLIIVMLRK
ncbi:MAG: hypothetical protein JW888_12560 [Pirellulales bacterium]|nr:hypothetical protein [Pirellulales bacterium]